VLALKRFNCTADPDGVLSENPVCKFVPVRNMFGKLQFGITLKTVLKEIKVFMNKIYVMTVKS
jgi:hypothetical protein